MVRRGTPISKAAVIIKPMRTEEFCASGFLELLGYWMILCFIPLPCQQKVIISCRWRCPLDVWYMAWVKQICPYLKKSDSSSVSCRAISIGWSVIRSNCSIFPGLQMCHSAGGGEFWKVMLWLGTFTWTCFFLCIIFVIDSTHFLIVLPVTQTHNACVRWVSVCVHVRQCMLPLMDAINSSNVLSSSGSLSKS